MKESRRTFIKYLWIILGGAAFVELILVVLSFFRPIEKKKAGQDMKRMIKAGSSDSFKPGTVTAFVTGRFYLVRHDDGGFMALSGKCTHLGCAVPWDRENKKFTCPCHASQFDMLGNVIASPAQRAMDLFKVTIVNKEVLVDTGQIIRRNRFNKGQLVHPQTIAQQKAGNP